LHWHPKWNLEKALQETAAWYQAYQSQKDMYDFTVEQIEIYGKSEWNQ
jgi:CDP-glucose 4,6-dehydratase